MGWFSTVCPTFFQEFYEEAWRWLMTQMSFLPRLAPRSEGLPPSPPLDLQGQPGAKMSESPGAGVLFRSRRKEGSPGALQSLQPGPLERTASDWSWGGSGGDNRGPPGGTDLRFCGSINSQGSPLSHLRLSFLPEPFMLVLHLIPPPLLWPQLPIKLNLLLFSIQLRANNSTHKATH